MKIILYSSLVTSTVSFSVPLIHSTGKCLNAHSLSSNLEKYSHRRRQEISHGYSRNIYGVKSSGRALFAIPKKNEPKGNMFERKASAFTDIGEGDINDLPTMKDIDLDLVRQRLEHGPYNYRKTPSESVGIEELIDNTLNNVGDKLISANTASKSQTKLNIYAKVKALSSLDVPNLGLDSVWQARILLLISAALYGTNFTFVKILNENMPGSAGTAIRFALAGLVTIPLAFQRSATVNDDSSNFNMNVPLVNDETETQIQDYSQIATKGAILGGAEIGLWNAIGYLTQAAGLETTNAGTSAFICSLAVVVVPILDFLTGKKISSSQTLGALLAVVGVAFLELDGFQGNLAAGQGIALSTGDMLSLVQPLAFGVGFWRMEHYMRKFPNEAMKLTASQLSVIAMASVAFFLATSGGVAGIPDFNQLAEWMSSPLIVGSLLWTGIMTTALTVYMETLALKTLSAAETTMLFSTEPIFGGACAAAVLGEQFGLGGLIGAAMVLSGCIASNIGTNDGDD